MWRRVNFAHSTVWRCCYMCSPPLLDFHKITESCSYREAPVIRIILPCNALLSGSVHSLGTWSLHISNHPCHRLNHHVLYDQLLLLLCHERTGSVADESPIHRRELHRWQQQNGIILHLFFSSFFFITGSDEGTQLLQFDMSCEFASHLSWKGNLCHFQHVTDRVLTQNFEYIPYTKFPRVSKYCQVSNMSYSISHLVKKITKHMRSAPK